MAIALPNRSTLSASLAPPARPPRPIATPSSGPDATPRPPTEGREPGALAVVVVLALFVGVPWEIRPLEAWLAPSRVAAIGWLLETALGVALGVWVFRLIRRQRLLSRLHASELERVTDSDALTGLGNGRALRRDLELTLNRARRTREPVSLLVLDVAALREVNRSHGRAVGDQTLRMLGAVLRSSVRLGVDAGYRVGDDEFALVLATGHEASQAVCRRVEWNFRERTPRRSEVSAGIASWDGRATPERLIEEARARRQMAGNAGSGGSEAVSAGAALAIS